MNFFEEATLRLKQQLQTTQDKEVAAALGLSAQAWVGRKNRGNFPEKELRAIYAYLMAQPAVKNRVPDYAPPAATTAKAGG